jgi:flagellar biosynthesis protein FlhG
MFDQADDLRRLATEHHRPKAAQAGSRPTLLAITGGKGGVGTTTAAVCLATSLSKIGRRALLIDADPLGGDAALQCGVEEQHTLADLLAGRRVWTEVIQPGPKGIQMVAGGRWSDELGNRVPVAAELLNELLNDPAVEADVVVVDVGNRPGRAGQRLCQVADAVVMVTTSEIASVIGAFECIKKLVPVLYNANPETRQQALPLHLLVNMARTAREAETVRKRLNRACRRLLGIELLGMDMAGAGSAVLRTAALFARFHPHGPLLKQSNEHFFCLSENQ